jgi:hypothetical protein
MADRIRKERMLDPPERFTTISIPFSLMIVAMRSSPDGMTWACISTIPGRDFRAAVAA